MTPWDYLQKYTEPGRSTARHRPWLSHVESTTMAALVEQYRQSIAHLPTGAVILLAEPDPVKFLAAWVAAASAPYRLILGNPHWQTQEWSQLYRFIAPNLIIGSAPTLPIPQTEPVIGSAPNFPTPQTEPNLPPQAILIPTGGTSGQLKFAIHTWDTLSAAVTGLQQYFLMSQPINACCVLPLYHVSGLMQAVRSLITGGQLTLHPWKLLESGRLPTASPQGFLSLVPTQLVKLLEPEQSPTIDGLRTFAAIFLGGAPAWESLLDRARQLHLPIAPTYGMTETAGQIATLKPQDFLAGQTGCGQVLPHAQITLFDTQLQIKSQSLMLGYFPESQQFQPDDLGYFDAHRSLHIIGRNSDKIITGGENVFPAELEALLRRTQLVTDVAVIGIPDGTWGEAIAVAYVPSVATVTKAQLQLALGPLAPYKQPKYWFARHHLPRQPNGKLHRALLRSQLTSPSSI